MALAPTFASHALNVNAPIPVHTIEICEYINLDYVCPFSAKIFKTIYECVKPLVETQYVKRVQIIFRHQVQPWHPTSTMVHEAALAVEKIDKTKFWEFSKALFENQVDYFDVNTANLSRNEVYQKLDTLATSVGIGAGETLEILKISDSPVNGAYNTGNQITTDLKLHIKAARLVGIHVSPSVVFNGNLESTISSGWSEDEWKDWFTKNI
ncbi:hypothetical protein EDC01DRAFT_688460, partial [Geopyxis carbonaria]